MILREIWPGAVNAKVSALSLCCGRSPGPTIAAILPPAQGRCTSGPAAQVGRSVSAKRAALADRAGLAAAPPRGHKKNFRLLFNIATAEPATLDYQAHWEVPFSICVYSDASAFPAKRSLSRGRKHSFDSNSSAGGRAARRSESAWPQRESAKLHFVLS